MSNKELFAYSIPSNGPFEDNKNINVFKEVQNILDNHPAVKNGFLKIEYANNGSELAIKIEIINSNSKKAIMMLCRVKDTKFYDCLTNHEIKFENDIDNSTFLMIGQIPLDEAEGLLSIINPDMEYYGQVVAAYQYKNIPNISEVLDHLSKVIIKNNQIH